MMTARYPPVPRIVSLRSVRRNVGSQVFMA
jgi:hypothetical protein